MHLQSQNYVEAALTLKLHSDLYPWDLNSFVPPMEELGLPQQSKFHRKETLCLLILDYLGQRSLNLSIIRFLLGKQAKERLGNVLSTFALSLLHSIQRSHLISTTYLILCGPS